MRHAPRPPEGPPAQGPVAATPRRRPDPWRGAAIAISIGLVFAIVSPLLLGIWGAVTTQSSMGHSTPPGPGWSQTTGPAGAEEAEALGVFASGARPTDGRFTVFWFRYVIEVYGDTIKLSLFLAALSIATCIPLGVLGGYALVRYRFRGKGLLEELVFIPLSLPGITLAIALIETYGVLRGHWLVIFFGHLLYTLPFMLLAVTNALRSCNFIELEMAASSLGASWRQRFIWILLPNLRHAIITGSLLVFTISLGEFNASFLLNTPINQTFPAALYDAYTNDSFQVSSAATTIFLLIVVPVLMAIQFIGGPEMRSTVRPT